MARPFPFLRFLPVFCALIAGPVHGQSAPAPAGPGPLAPPAVVVAPSTGSETLIGPIKFGDITVDAALEMLERWSGRSVLRPAGLPATSLSFSLNQKVTRDEARQALETLLALNGIAVSPLGGKFLKVTPLNVARTETPNFIEGSTLGLPATGGIASKLFQLKFLRVGEFSPQLAGMINAAAGAPVIFDKSNSILVTDTIANLQRVETLLAQLDQPSFEGLTPKFYKIHNSTASALVTKLQSLLSGNAATQIGTNTSYQADDRTNQIILLSDPRQQPLFDDLINRLDSAGESSTRQEVIPLKHATATEVATLLSSLISGQNSVNSRAGGQQNASQQIAAARNAAVAAINAANARNAGPNGQNNGGPNGAANRPVINQPPVVIANGFATPNQGDISQQFSTILTVVADDRSNALVVSGTVDDLRLIKDIVTQLDVLLAQVRIEVVIAEITLTDAASTGIGSLGLVVSGNKLVGFNGSGPGFGVGGAPDASGNATPYATLTRNLTGGTDLAGTLNLTTTPRKSNTNILSVPNIVTTHNKEATIFVGESRPVITSYQNSGVATGTIGSGYTSNVTYKDIGIRLTVKPLIGNDGSVQLDIKQEVNDILDNVTIDGNSQPVIGSRTTESFVSVNSNEIVVLGGLQRKAQNKSTSRLGGIPIIGDLLGTRTREVTRTDLVFFLRPYVLTNTAVDNHEALDRLKDSPQQKDIQSALQGTLISKP
ncbi:MAG: secretin N-terminal domain-containing protein [Lacunisphaera sp.]